MTKPSEVIDILLSPSRSLKQLAGLSSFDNFHFYRGADLTGLDLTGQDLKTLNFDGADFSGSKLDQVMFDAGSLNNAKLESEYGDFQDNFDLSLFDLKNRFVGALAAVYRIRPISIANIIKQRRLAIREFAASSGIPAGTLWRLRNGHSVTYSTMRRFVDFVVEDEVMLGFSPSERAEMSQPMIEAKTPERHPLNSTELLELADILEKSWKIKPEALHNEHQLRKIHPEYVRLITFEGPEITLHF